ncbi:MULTISPECIES: acylneuraminate cytidylyltransferase family protein [unclassified Roseobacter]|uniref:acylneuraminate cytidylyltransferase family protein n=1 Tax=unclassified Roseobacter TaxID=196798 RepID=UPI0030EC8B49
MKKVCCIIPARSGSKGIPQKNLLSFGGKPLIAWSIEAALACDRIDRVVVSTDCRKIAKVAKAFGAEVPFLRPSSLAADDVHATNVVIHAVDWLSVNEGYSPTAVLMLLPTSPLRTNHDICRSIDLLFAQDAPAVVSIVRTGKYLNNLRYFDGENMELVACSDKINLQRQELRELYAVNGSIFIAKTAVLMSEKNFHVVGAKGYEMSFEHSVDINGHDDLWLASLLLSNR